MAALQALGVTATRGAALTGDASQYALAEDAFDRADALTLDHPHTLIGRANLQLSLHAFAAAEDLALRAVAALPGNPAALAALVDAQVELGDYDAAAVTLQALLDREPALPALARTSYLRQLTGDVDGAILALRQAQAAGADQPVDVASIAALRGEVALEAGDLAGARSAFERAESLTAGLLGVAVGRAQVLAAEGDLAAARALLRARRRPRARRPRPRRSWATSRPPPVMTPRPRTPTPWSAPPSRCRPTPARSSTSRPRSSRPTTATPPPRSAAAQAAYEARPDNVFAQAALAWALHADGRTERGRRRSHATRCAWAPPTARCASARPRSSRLRATRTPRAPRCRPVVESGAPWPVAYRDAGDALAAELGLTP